MRTVLLPDGSRIATWSSSDGKDRPWFETAALWTLADLRRWRGEHGMLASLRAFLTEFLPSPDLTTWPDERVFSEIAQRIEDGRLIRERDGAAERRGVAGVPSTAHAEAPPPLRKVPPPAKPAPSPTVVATARFGPEAEGLRKAAEEGSAFYCNCDACLAKATA